MGNLVQNDEEIMVLINYVVYVNNTVNFSPTEKKNLSKIPWLNSSGLKKSTDENLSQISNDLPDFINNSRKETRKEDNETVDNKVIDVSDNAEGMKKILI